MKLPAPLWMLMSVPVVLSAGAFARADVEADKAIMELQRQYRSAPSCERIGIEVRAPGGGATATRVARSTILVRLGASVEERGPQVLGMELGGLRFWCVPNEMLAVHARDPSIYFRAELGPAISTRALAEAIPPVSLPQLDLAAAEPGKPCQEFWPYAKGIRWTSVEADQRAPGRKTIKGEFDGGSVTVVSQGGSGGGGGARLRMLTIDRAADRAAISMSFSAVSPCDPGKSAIDVDRRTRVESMEDLRPKSGTLRTGVRVPDLPFTSRSGERWAIADLLQVPHEFALGGGALPEHAVLVLWRVLGPGVPTSLPRFKTRELGDALHGLQKAAFMRRTDAMSGEAIPPMARFGYAPVLVMSGPAPDQVLASIKETSDQWGTDVLWTTEAKSSIDLFAPGAEAVAIVLDSEGVLRAVVNIEPSQTTEQIADQIAAALFELAPAEGAVKP